MKIVMTGQPDSLGVPILKCFIGLFISPHGVMVCYHEAVEPDKEGWEGKRYVKISLSLSGFLCAQRVSERGSQYLSRPS